MDQVLSNLIPSQRIGQDGFQWWVGQIEGTASDEENNKGGYRFKVRIVGDHPGNPEILGTDDLPWSSVMMPVTAPFIPGNCGGAHPQLEIGCWVMGFYIDTEKQKPIIMGSIGQTPGATKVFVERTPETKPFTTAVGQLNIQKVGIPVQKGTGKNTSTGGLSDGTKDGDGNERVGVAPAKIAPLKNGLPQSEDWCQGKAEKCDEEDMMSSMTNIMGEFLAAVQANDGNVGTYLVNKATGEFYDSISLARGYVNKAMTVVNEFVARIKGFVIETISKAVKNLIKALLRPDDTGNALTPVTEFFNNLLKQLGCSIADLGDRLEAWLTNILMSLIQQIYQSVACQVDALVNGIMSKINSLMTELLNSILGPLQSILGAIAKPLDMIGQAINKVLSLLGIQCSGPGQKCAKKTKVCTDCAGDKREDFLDKLLASLNDSDSQDWNQYNCDDTQEGTKLKPTDVDFIGGIQNPDRNIVYNITNITVNEGEKAVFTVTRSGYTDVISSLTYKTRNGTATAGEDYEEKSGTLGFVAGVKTATIEVRTFEDSLDDGYEDFYLRLAIDTPGREISRSNFKRNIARCTIKETSITQGVSSPVDSDTGTPMTANPVDATSNPDADPFTGNVSIPTGTAEPSTDPTYNVSADKASVEEGGFVKYTITTTNVPNGTSLSYQLFGSGITPSDIVSNNLTGTFIIEESTATVIVGIRKDDVSEDGETMIFAISGTGASVSVLIISNLADLSEEEIANLEDTSTNNIVDNSPILPTAGSVVTDRGGSIITIPVDTSGDPYTEPPSVFITGEGYGAQGEALLDTNGFVREIRVTDPGFGYKINKPVNAELECIIDSFTMIRPGQGYTSEPKVFVDGDDRVAEAVINTKGQIVSVRIRNRSVIFEEYPEIKILGGGGYGAKFVPSFACLEPAARVKIGSAKIGTGSYIDCP